MGALLMKMNTRVTHRKRFTEQSVKMKRAKWTDTTVRAQCVPTAPHAFLEGASMVHRTRAQLRQWAQAARAASASGVRTSGWHKPSSRGQRPLPPKARGFSHQETLACHPLLAL